MKQRMTQPIIDNPMKRSRPSGPLGWVISKVPGVFVQRGKGQLGRVTTTGHLRLTKVDEGNADHVAAARYSM